MNQHHLKLYIQIQHSKIPCLSLAVAFTYGENKVQMLLLYDRNLIISYFVFKHLQDQLFSVNITRPFTRVKSVFVSIHKGYGVGVGRTCLIGVKEGNYLFSLI